MVPALREMDLADAPVLHRLDRTLEMRTGPLLNAHLHDAVGAARCLHHQAAFAHIVGDRLFDVHILPGLQASTSISACQ